MLVSLRKHTWRLGEGVGSGGFGSVFAASSDGYPDAVAKLVPKAPGAERELLFNAPVGIRNVVPVIDDGETDDAWVMVMPRADMSLRDHLSARGPGLPLEEARAILLDVADALSDMDGRIVHRDVKPENVLLLSGSWCLADFGISRYAEAATAAETRKHAMSPLYAAPERWRSERATGAADVYPLGVMAHEMLAGELPFQAAEFHGLRDGHLHRTPPALVEVPAAVRSLVLECLGKAPGARPSAAEFASRLRRSASIPPSAGLAALAEAHVRDVEVRSGIERRKSEDRTEAERVASLLSEAQASHGRIGSELLASLQEAVPSAQVEKGRNGFWRLYMKHATMLFEGCVATPANPWQKWEPPAIEVVAHSRIGVTFPEDRHGYAGRSHSLWFCDAKSAGTFGWFETAFCTVLGRRSNVVPFALPPGEEAAKALWTGLAEFQVAWPFERLVSGELEPFVGRWAGWLAAASRQALGHPSTVPEKRADGSWRQR